MLVIKMLHVHMCVCVVLFIQKYYLIPYKLMGGFIQVYKILIGRMLGRILQSLCHFH